MIPSKSGHIAHLNPLPIFQKNGALEKPIESDVNLIMISQTQRYFGTQRGVSSQDFLTVEHVVCMDVLLLDTSHNSTCLNVQ